MIYFNSIFLLCGIAAKEEEGDPGVGTRGQGLLGFVVEEKGSKGRRRSRGGGEGKGCLGLLEYRIEGKGEMGGERRL